jgi:hypothetical protein
MAGKRMSPHLKTLTRDALLVALAAGASSLMTYRLTRPPTEPHAVRGTRFELVDGSGEIRAALEPAGNSESGLAPCIRFMDRHGNSRMEVGLRFKDEDPYVLLIANDKRPRISLGIDSYGNPALNMSDHQWDGRLLLGTLPGDIATTEPLQDWGLYLNPAEGQLCGTVGERRMVLR